MRKGFMMIELFVVAITATLAAACPVWAQVPDQVEEEVVAVPDGTADAPTILGVVAGVAGKTPQAVPAPTAQLQGGLPTGEQSAAAPNPAPAPAAEAQPADKAGDAEVAAHPAARQGVVERRIDVVRQLAAAHQRGDNGAVKRLTTELEQLTGRLALVESNPLGGTEGQRSMWRELHDAGVRSESYLREHYGFEPVSASVTEQDSMPATPAKGRGDMPLSLQIVLGAIAIAGAACAIVALTRGNNLAVLAGALGDAANRAQNNERLTFSAGPGRMRLTVEPANATPVIPPAPLGVAYVPVQVNANPVTLNPAAPAAR